MEDDWVGHMMETHAGKASCLINVALSKFCPDAKRPVCTVVRIPFRDAREDGFGADAERERFGEFKDRLERGVRRSGGVHVASVRGGGALDIWYYSSPKGADELSGLARSICKGYEIEVGSHTDPRWEQYRAMYPSPAALDHFHDFQLISLLQDKGDQVEKPRPVDHALYLPGTASADKAVQLAATKGFKETDRRREGAGKLPVLLQLTKTHSVESEVVGDARSFLTSIARSLGGEYDGWQTPLAT